MQNNAMPDTTTSAGAIGTVTLHPNLARIAVQYQGLVQQYAAGQVDASQAASLMRELVSRDDEGTQWTINPRDGGWLRCTTRGEWVPGTPPQSGFATISAWEISGGANPDSALTFEREKPAVQVGYRGATGVVARNRTRVAQSSGRPRWVYPVLVVGVLLVGLMFVLSRMDDGTPISSSSTIPASADAVVID